MFPKERRKISIIGSSLQATILESGNLMELRKGSIRLNTYVGNNLEPTISNIYMRVEENNEYNYTRLVGIESPSKFAVLDNKVIYKGLFNGVFYTVFFEIIDNAFFYTVKVRKNNNSSKRISIFYGMDISLSDINAINSNEAYVSQYVDHKAFTTENGYIFCSRQNQGNPYYLEQGSLSKNIGYSSDGFQFFGLDCKLSNKIKALEENKLCNEIYQYEFGYCALQSPIVDLTMDREFIFYGCFGDLHPEEIKEPLYTEYVQKLYQDKTEEFEVEEEVKLSVEFNDILVAQRFNETELDSLYPEKYQEEYYDGKMLSFFSDNKEHIVLPEKELFMERPSGNILISMNNLPDGSYDFEQILADTCYIYGVFNSQIVYGNTSFNKLLSNQRNPLNLQKISGQRIFIKKNKKYQLLTMPSLFVMGLNYCKWYYKLDNDVIIISSTISSSSSKVMLHFTSLKDCEYDIIVSNLITMGQTENENRVFVRKEDNEIRFDFDKDSMTCNKYPEYYFKMKCDKEFIVSDDRIFYKNKRSCNENIVALSLKEKEFRLLIIGKNEENEKNEEFIEEESENKKYLYSIKNLVNDLNISIDNKASDETKRNIQSFNYLTYWYAHDALVHYLSPHGLEQYNGAAWGTRDVCQGPSEFYMAMNKYDEVRRIILNVYKHQFFDNGDFPQWFMFDRFSYIQDSGSHGDIIVWPARLIGLYLLATKDYKILEEELVYTNRGIATLTNEKYSLIHHLKKELDTIKKSFIKGTYLSCYGGGDWDDTLQPVRSEDKQKMVSGWTVSLTYEMFKNLEKVFKEYDEALSNECQLIANNIQIDYNKYIVKDKVPAGFIRFDNDGIKYIIHPSDNVTNMKYRLLPLTRGIISGIFTDEQRKNADQIIDSNLMFPDGVRLMDNTVPYRGGVKTFFNRAETAANFGREIGLQYCHAHIRYCEAMSKLGLGDKLYSSLIKINPILVHNVVKNAEPRQRNSYFSSSDGDFLNRYQAMKNYQSLRTGEVKVKGGWRVYSSGPGIFLSTFIKGLLGIAISSDTLTLNPVIPITLDGLKVKISINGKEVFIYYHKTNGDTKAILNDKEINLKENNLKINVSIDDLIEKNNIELFIR